MLQMHRHMEMDPRIPSDSVKTPSRSSYLAKPDADLDGSLVQPPWLIQLSQERPLLRIRQVNHGHTGTLHLPNTNLRLLVRRDGLVLRLTHDGGIAGVVTHAEVPPDGRSLPPDDRTGESHPRNTPEDNRARVPNPPPPGSHFRLQVLRENPPEHEGARDRGGQHFCTEFSMANRNRRDLTNRSMTNLDQDFGQPLGVLQTFELSQCGRYTDRFTTGA